MLLNKTTLLFLLSIKVFYCAAQDKIDVIRINLMGYMPGSEKTAVWCSKENKTVQVFYVVNANTNQQVFTESAGKAFGAYGPFQQTQRLCFSAFTIPGSYYIEAGGVRSPVFKIDDTVYKGSADFCLRYMRQQRSGFNPFLKDSCHTHDGYTLYGPMPDSTHVDVSGLARCQRLPAICHYIGQCHLSFADGLS